MIQALLVGGPPGLRTDILDALETLRPQSSCTIVSGIRAGRQLAATSSPGFDIVVLDLRLTDADAAVLLVDLHSASSIRPIVALPAEDRRSDVVGALQLGASGVLSRDAAPDEVVACLRSVLDGGIWMPLALMRTPMAAPTSGLAQLPNDAARAGPAELGRLGLTARQTEVLGMLLRGRSNKEIARELNLSVETVKDHVAAVLRGLSVHSRTQAVLAVERMLREPDVGRLRVASPSLQSAWGPVATLHPSEASSPR